MQSSVHNPLTADLYCVLYLPALTLSPLHRDSAVRDAQVLPAYIMMVLTTLYCYCSWLHVSQANMHIYGYKTVHITFYWPRHEQSFIAINKTGCSVVGSVVAMCSLRDRKRLILIKFMCAWPVCNVLHSSCVVFYTEIDSWVLLYLYVPHLITVVSIRQTLSTDSIKPYCYNKYYFQWLLHLLSLLIYSKGSLCLPTASLQHSCTCPLPPLAD